jgi:antitoxin component YwqK of YwqJK toxin-antitoxin module
MIKTLLIILALSSSPSDDSLVFQSPQQIFEKASALESDENYEAALELYHLISESDTSYIKAQFKKMALYNATGHYDKTIEIGLSLKDKYTPLRENIYIELGNAYSKEEKYHRALEIYQEGSALFPYSHVLLYNIGLAYRNLEDYKTALSYFKKSARINPYYMNNHVMLGYISMLQGHRSKAMMSYLMSLAISPDNNGILVFLESLSSDAIRIEGSIEKFESNELFQYYDDIIRSRAAQDPRFVQEVDFNANIIKNTELLLQKLEYRDNTDDFWMNYYVPFYFNLAKQNLEPHFLYYTLYSTNNDEVKKFINKNSDEKDAWISLANEYLSSNRSTQHATVMGQKDEYSFWYYNSNALSAIGNQIDDETRTGPWMFFYESGQLNAIGKYDDSGNKTGLWKYYHENGRLSRTEKYQENAIVEPARYYHENGALSIIAHYDGEILDGSLEHYYACGALKEIIPLKQGVKSGSGQYLFNTGQKMTDYLIQNDTLSGLYKKFF